MIEVPLTLPLDAELPPEREEQARRALARAARWARSTRTSTVSAEVIRARNAGAGIVEAARRGGSEAIVIGGEPPTKIRGGGSSAGSAPPSPPRSAPRPSTC